MGMSFGVHSEVGRLHKVMVHRPGREHARLTSSNAEEVTTHIYERASIITLPAILVEAPPSTSAGRRRQPAGGSGCDRRTSSADRHAHADDVPPPISET
jgi:hypothetical protein